MGQTREEFLAELAAASKAQPDAPDYVLLESGWLEADDLSIAELPPRARIDCHDAHESLRIFIEREEADLRVIVEYRENFASPPPPEAGAGDANPMLLQGALLEVLRSIRKMGNAGLQDVRFPADDPGEISVEYRLPASGPLRSVLSRVRDDALCALRIAGTVAAEASARARAIVAAR